jgi:circadian clock protein KaiC
VTNADGRQRVVINSLSSRVPGLDEVTGGGIPEYSFNLIAGAPGTGKTTLAHQIMFDLATTERPALHFTVLGEPALKMLRYQQQFSFFDFAKVEDGRVRFVNLSEQAIRGDLRAILDAIKEQVEQTNPGIVVVDSFRTIVRAADGSSGSDIGLAGFLQELAMLLTSWQATTFLVGEYLDSEIQDNPVFTIADGVLWLHQSVDRNSIVRKLHVVKMRGHAPLPGLHTMRITSDGVQIFPRIIRRITEIDSPRPSGRLSVGIEELDEMLGGGIPAWDAVLVAGPAGSGKSALATQFIAAGLELGEPAVIAVFEEHPREYLERAKTLGHPNLDEMIRRGLLEVLYLRPLDLSVDEALLEIQQAVARSGAMRMSIDSLSGFELALAPTFREDFRESLYRMVGALTGSGVTVFMTMEVPQSFTDLVFTPNLVSFLTDDLIIQRYIELDGQLRKAMAIVKMRGSGHSHDIRLYEVTEHGLEIGEPLTAYSGVLTGVPVRRDALTEPNRA